MNYHKSSFSLVAGAAMLFTASYALACDCFGLTIEEHFDKLEIVFLGTISEYKEQQEVSYTVDEVFKGDFKVDDTVTSKIEGFCDFYALSSTPIGEQHLVLGALTKDDESTWEINDCGGSTPVAHREDSLELLRGTKSHHSMIPCTPSQVVTPENKLNTDDESETDDRSASKTSSSSLPSPAATL
ncbi:MAG: hypothetical protein HKM24_05725 [Gammaproteobacteria bacterium]|nr:hypothetical protein [Gammaproteobacteria bacterium]